jgi:hypothetical protein
LRALKTAEGKWAEDVLTLSRADVRQLTEVYKITAADTTRKEYSPDEEAQMRQQSKQAGNAAVALARERQAKPLMQHLEFNKGEVQYRTMHKTPPEFYIQKHFPWRGMEKTRTVPKDRDDILEALKLLDRMLAKPELDAAKPEGKRTSLAASTFWTDAEQATAREQAAHNVALQHMLAELHRRYVHMETHTEAPVERFDMNWRKELRNEQVADPRRGNKTVWQNCLVVCTPQPEKEDETEAQGKKAGNKRKYTTEKVYYNSLDKTAADGELETMWRGDKYVIRYGGRDVHSGASGGSRASLSPIHSTEPSRGRMRGASSLRAWRRPATTCLATRQSWPSCWCLATRSSARRRPAAKARRLHRRCQTQTRSAEARWRSYRGSASKTNSSGSMAAALWILIARVTRRTPTRPT